MYRYTFVLTYVYVPINRSAKGILSDKRRLRSRIDSNRIQTKPANVVITRIIVYYYFFFSTCGARYFFNYLIRVFFFFLRTRVTAYVTYIVKTCGEYDGNKLFKNIAPLSPCDPSLVDSTSHACAHTITSVAVLPPDGRGKSVGRDNRFVRQKCKRRNSSPR